MAKEYETVIGLEVHVELATKTKIFCSCSTEFGGAPNTHTCPVCTGMPGSLPVLNKQVVEYAAAVGLATNCTITQYCKFDRKNYFYPDNPQNYQISQLYLPICRDGKVEIETEDGTKNIGIHEIHMEEDAGKLVHDEWDDVSVVDYNRSGVPLIEIVSEPDMRSADEVIAYLEKLRMIVQYLGASDCKLNEGSMRADVNLSVREVGAKEFGTRTEMKNLNSFKAIARAIEGERERQIDLLEAGEKVIQETRRWDDTKGESYPMRSKEDAQDGSGGKDSCNRLLCRTETGGSEPDRRSVPCLRCEGQIPGGRKDDGHAPRGGDGLGGQFQAAEHGCRVQGNLQGDPVRLLDRRKDPLVPQGPGRLQQLLRLLYGALRQRRFQEYSDRRSRLPGRADRSGRSPRDCPHGSELRRHGHR